MSSQLDNSFLQCPVHSPKLGLGACIHVDRWELWITTWLIMVMDTVTLDIDTVTEGDVVAPDKDMKTPDNYIL